MKNKPNIFIKQIQTFAEQKSKSNLQKELQMYNNRYNYIKIRELEFNKLKEIQSNQIYCKTRPTFFKVKNEILIAYSSGIITINDKEYFITNCPIIFAFFNEFWFCITNLGCVYKLENEIFIEVYNINTRLIVCDYHIQLNYLLCTDISNNIFCIDLQNFRPIFKNTIFELRNIKLHEYGHIFIGDSNSCNIIDLKSMKTIYNFNKNVLKSDFLNYKSIICIENNQIVCYDLRMLKESGRILSHFEDVDMLKCDKYCYTATHNGELVVSSPELSIIHKEMKFERIGNFDVFENQIFLLNKKKT